MATQNEIDFEVIEIRDGEQYLNDKRRALGAKLAQWSDVETDNAIEYLEENYVCIPIRDNDVKTYHYYILNGDDKDQFLLEICERWNNDTDNGKYIIVGDGLTYMSDD